MGAVTFRTPYLQEKKDHPSNEVGMGLRPVCSRGCCAKISIKARNKTRVQGKPANPRGEAGAEGRGGGQGHDKGEKRMLMGMT